MRIGIVTDIHEAVGKLRLALSVLAHERVDVIVQLGDAIDLPRESAIETVELLVAAKVLGVWGNHDLGFCVDVPEFVKQKVPQWVLTYMAGMQPRFELEGCLFSHADPYLDPYDPAAYYLPVGDPNTAERVAPSFAVVPNRICFVGHYHRWSITTEVGSVVWDKQSPITLAPPSRFLVVIGPLVSGEFGVYDTDTCVFTPHRC